MTLATLTAWILSLPAVHDGHGYPIARPTAEPAVIATVTLEHPEVDARWLAATLDVLAAHESGYRTGARGDHGASCGAWQTPCSVTPMEGADLATRQARVAVSIWLRSVSVCPDHPIWAYAAGHCVRTRVAALYEAEITTEVGQ